MSHAHLTNRAPDTTAAQAAATTLADLWANAEAHGHVRIHSGENYPRPRSYHCVITFPTIEGTALEARSEFGQTLVVALNQAIEKAEKIRAHFK